MDYPQIRPIDTLEEARALHRRLDALRLRTEAPPNHLACRDETVSAWSVAQHLQHAALSAEQMLDGIRAIQNRQAPAQPGGTPGRIWRIVLHRRRIPRGQGRAPAAVRPDADPSADEIERIIVQALERLAAISGSLEDLEANPCRIAHPYFGPLSGAEWLFLAAVHTQHHLEIIEEIEHAL